jgi:hypothetical protein
LVSVSHGIDERTPQIDQVTTNSEYQARRAALRFQIGSLK